MAAATLGDDGVRSVRKRFWPAIAEQRGGRIDSPAGSGELEKQVQMVVEGSVLYAAGVRTESAFGVAPDGSGVVGSFAQNFAGWRIPFESPPIRSIGTAPWGESAHPPRSPPARRPTQDSAT